MTVNTGGAGGLTVDDVSPTGLVCFSGGKDSAAMLLRMLELNDPVNYPVTRIAFADTGFEFPDLYEYIKLIQAYLDDHYGHLGLTIEYLKPASTWDDWFYGIVERGDNKGKTRGAPLRVYPCWWSRESKLFPLHRLNTDMGATFQFVGIAYDEQGRIKKKDNDWNKNIRYPLNEWKWTEQDCLSYLEHLGLPNKLYAHFNRLGCFHCPKQNARSWHQLWKEYPDLWEISKHWDNESLRVGGLTIAGGINVKGEPKTLEEAEVLFKQGYIPASNQGKFDCKSCNAVSFTSTGDLVIEDFDDDQAYERDPELLRRFGDKAPDVEWIPPSHAAAQHIEAADFGTWFKVDAIRIDEDEPTDDCFFDEDA